jgi:hypothetical protein
LVRWLINDEVYPSGDWAGSIDIKMLVVREIMKTISHVITDSIILDFLPESRPGDWLS